MSDSSSTVTTADRPSSAGTSSERVPAPKRKRRWLRWLCGVFVALVLFIIFLPTLAALPIFRGALFSVLFPSLQQRVTLDELSLGWFSPIRAGGVRLQGDEGKTPALAIREIAGSATLWQMLTGGELGEFQISEPAVFVEFDQTGSNWERLIQEIHGSPQLDRTVKLKITDAKVSLQGPESPAPWSLDKLSTNVSFSPAVANKHGVPLIEGDKLVLLDKTELTPEICNDLLKYIVPAFAGVTRASGRVSLAIDDYSWPIGKPNEANVKGRLILHSVQMGPGAITSAMAKAALEGVKLPESMTVAQEDTVEFSIENGRVHHREFAFGLVDFQPDRLVRTHGSVGFDQTLDLHVQAPIPGAALLGEGTVRDALMKQVINVDFGGTLQQPTWKLGLNGGSGLDPSQVRNAIGDILERRRERLQETPPRPGLLRNRRRGGDDAAKPMQ
jgi:hypothetical protein